MSFSNVWDYQIMRFLKGRVDYLKVHVFSIIRVLKSMYNCKMYWEHKPNIFSFQAPCTFWHYSPESQISSHIIHVGLAPSKSCTNMFVVLHTLLSGVTGNISEKKLCKAITTAVGLQLRAVVKGRLWVITDPKAAVKGRLWKTVPS